MDLDIVCNMIKSFGLGLTFTPIHVGIHISNDYELEYYCSENELGTALSYLCPGALDGKYMVNISGTYYAKHEQIMSMICDDITDLVLWYINIAYSLHIIGIVCSLDIVIRGSVRDNSS